MWLMNCQSWASYPIEMRWDREMTAEETTLRERGLGADDTSAGRFSVVMVTNSEGTVPDWVLQGLADARVQFAYRECRDGDEVAELAREADLVWVRSSRRLLTAETIDRLPTCCAILRTGAGTDNVDSGAATKAGILVANTPEAVTDTTSDHAIALLFSVVRRIPMSYVSLKEGRWVRSSGKPTRTVCGGTLGLVGLGRIGRRVARKVSGLEMEVLAFDPFVSKQAMEGLGIEKVPLDELLRRSDFVSLHVPLTAETAHLIGERELRLMRPEAYLINCARGSVVDEEALHRALSEGRIAGAGLDVTEGEPPEPGDPLLQLDNVVITPHIGGASDASRDGMWRLSVETIIDLAEGRWPRSVVNRGVEPRRKLAGHPED